MLARSGIIAVPVQTFTGAIMEYVTLVNLAQEFGIDRSHIRKYVLKNGFSPVRIRTPESGGQQTLALTREDAESVRALRQQQGFNHYTPTPNGTDGFFYIIQVVPELSPNRVKLGFANNAQDRLASHRTSAPTAVLVRAWQCKRPWEACAIASIARIGCKLVANEVYEADSIQNLISRGNEFFKIMPQME